VVAASTPHLGDAATRRIRTLAGEITDWNAVAELADACRALPILHDRLRRSGATLPESVATRLQQAYMANTARTAGMVRSLAVVMDALDAAGIPAVTFKGPTLAQLAYSDPGVRQFDDLDIVVPPRHLREAKRIAEGQGYAEVLELPPGVELSAFRPSKPYILRHADGSHDIDLTTDVFHDYFSFRFPATKLWSSHQDVIVDDQPLRTVSLDVLFLYLCLHGSKHLWSRPAWSADVAGLLFRAREQIDWGNVRKLAQDGDGLRMLQLGVALAGRFYDAPLPQEHEEWLRPSPLVAEVADRIERRQRETIGQPERDSVERLRIHLSLRARLRSRLRYLLVRGLTPSYNDWRALRLPAALFPLYYVVRPFRLLAGLITRRGRRNPPLFPGCNHRTRHQHRHTPSPRSFGPVWTASRQTGGPAH
jgi:hypothetical protein